ncbi:major pollen allergen Ole e 10-like [Dendrobium catenatum]|uniref:major pollen allergen Ole e 10-like n=1 Tax=Dendrobium catenatum TaxID=906689 RepID=UPI00109F32C7|nr:major pollen allergen Ole e 10-like [Dendrobium catenatum]
MGLRHVRRLVFIMNLLFSSGNLAKEPEDSSRYISTAMPQHDIVTPIPTVPAINPSNPTASTRPTYNPTPTDSNPSTPMITPSTMNPSMGMPSTSLGLSWCIASQSASETPLQVALDFACGYGGADCSQIQPGGSCFNPDTVRNHASYAFNDYYLKNPIPTSCDFGGTAIITNIDPSTSTCQYPSTR